MADTALLFRILARDDTRDGLNSSQTRMKKFSKVALGLSAGIAGGLLAMGKAGMEGVLSGVAAEEKFQDALSRSNAGLNANADALRKNSEELQRKTKFTDEDALGIATVIARQESLTNVIDKGVMSAVEMQNVIADVATVTGQTGSKAALALGKALAKPEAAARMLAKAGVDLTLKEQDKIKALMKAGKTAEAQKIVIDRLAAATKGAAIAAGDTMAGKMERAKNAFGEVQESLVVGLLPAVNKILTKFTAVTAWAQANPAKMKIIVMVLGGLAAVLLAVGVATKIWTAATKVAAAATKVWAGAQWLMNTAMFASPITWIVVGIIALIAVIVLIATKTTWFQDIWSAAWGAVKGAVSATFGWIKSNWPLILAIITGPIGMAVLLVTKNFDKIKGAASAVKDSFAHAFGALKDIVKGAINGVIGVIRRFGIPGFSIPIPFAPDISFGGAYPFSGIPMLAKGGKVLRSGATIVGERGAELLDLPKGATVTPLNSATKAKGAKAVGSSGGKVTVVLEVKGSDKVLVDMLRKSVRVGGGNVQRVLGSNT